MRDNIVIEAIAIPFAITAILLVYILLVERRPVSSIGLRLPTWKELCVRHCGRRHLGNWCRRHYFCCVPRAASPDKSVGRGQFVAYAVVVSASACNKSRGVRRAVLSGLHDRTRSRAYRSQVDRILRIRRGLHIHALELRWMGLSHLRWVRRRCIESVLHLAARSGLKHGGSFPYRRCAGPVDSAMGKLIGARRNVPLS